MHFALPTSGLHLPCAVPNFTGIAAMIAQPAYSVYTAASKVRTTVCLGIKLKHMVSCAYCKHIRYTWDILIVCCNEYLCCNN